MGSITYVDTVTLSPKFEVVIPPSMRAALKLTPGDKVHVFGYCDRVEIIPFRSMKSMPGFWRKEGSALDTAVIRDKDRI